MRDAGFRPGLLPGAFAAGSTAGRNALRLQRLQGVLNNWHADVQDFPEECEEDLRPYFNGERSPERYVCVTVNYSSHGEAKHFFLLFPSARQAKERAMEYAQDSLFEELPVAVIDLDEERTYKPMLRAEWRLA